MKGEFKAKVSPEDAEKAEKLAEDTLKWIEEHPEAYAEEFEGKKKEVESVFNPIATKAYQ